MAFSLDQLVRWICLGMCVAYILRSDSSKEDIYQIVSMKGTPPKDESAVFLGFKPIEITLLLRVLRSHAGLLSP